MTSQYRIGMLHTYLDLRRHDLFIIEQDMTWCSWQVLYCSLLRFFEVTRLLLTYEEWFICNSIFETVC